MKNNIPTYVKTYTEKVLGYQIQDSQYLKNNKTLIQNRGDEGTKVGNWKDWSTMLPEGYNLLHFDFEQDRGEYYVMIASHTSAPDGPRYAFWDRI